MGLFILNIHFSLMHQYLDDEDHLERLPILDDDDHLKRLPILDDDVILTCRLF